eukprot:jgi/Ulvmu1/3516/UM162_0023.1
MYLPYTSLMIVTKHMLACPSMRDPTSRQFLLQTTAKHQCVSTQAVDMNDALVHTISGLVQIGSASARAAPFKGPLPMDMEALLSASQRRFAQNSLAEADAAAAARDTAGHSDLADLEAFYQRSHEASSSPDFEPTVVQNEPPRRKITIGFKTEQKEVEEDVKVCLEETVHELDARAAALHTWFASGQARPVVRSPRKEDIWKPESGQTSPKILSWNPQASREQTATEWDWQQLSELTRAEKEKKGSASSPGAIKEDGQQSVAVSRASARALAASLSLLALPSVAAAADPADHSHVLPDGDDCAQHALCWDAAALQRAELSPGRGLARIATGTARSQRGSTALEDTPERSLSALHECSLEALGGLKERARMAAAPQQAQHTARQAANRRECEVRSRPQPPPCMGDSEIEHAADACRAAAPSTPAGAFLRCAAAPSTPAGAFLRRAAAPSTPAGAFLRRAAAPSTPAGAFLRRAAAPSTPPTQHPLPAVSPEIIDVLWMGVRPEELASPGQHAHAAHSMHARGGRSAMQWLKRAVTAVFALRATSEAAMLRLQ